MREGPIERSSKALNMHLLLWRLGSDLFWSPRTQQWMALEVWGSIPFTHCRVEQLSESSAYPQKVGFAENGHIAVRDSKSVKEKRGQLNFSESYNVHLHWELLNSKCTSILMLTPC